jgi:MoaA/NifB/PqqE/SkfB family radical SAM enzyme
MGLSLRKKGKAYVTRKGIEKIVALTREGDEGELVRLFEGISKLAPAKYHRESFRQLADMFRRGDPFVGVFRRAVRELNPACLQKLIQNLVVNFMVMGRGLREEQQRRHGVHLPNFMAISPTMRCNLDCKGCYAGQYDTSSELSFAELDRLLEEAKELGMYFFTITGGEAFFRADLLELFGKHGDCFFQVYTNGTLIDAAMARRLAELGNVMPMVSVEGSEGETDFRRGKGIYKRILAAYGHLREAGVLFGFSATYTNSSASYLSSDDFLRTMIDRGCLMGWFFQYVPIGSKPDLSYMATPEQRAFLHRQVERWRGNREFPIFIGDFWNDGPYVDGCMAGGQRYWHVISDGRVEPCVFVPFAVDNIREKSLIEIAKSPFFTDIRSAQPYGDDNLLRPCMILDHPEVLRALIGKHGASPCHCGLEKILEDDIADGLDVYARRTKTLFDPLWESGERERYLKSLEKEDDRALLDRAHRHDAAAATSRKESEQLA